MNSQEVKELFETHVPAAASHVGSTYTDVVVDAFEDASTGNIRVSWSAHDANGPQVQEGKPNVGANHIFAKGATEQHIIGDIQMNVMFYCLMFRQREGPFIMGALAAYDYLTDEDHKQRNPFALLDAVYRMHAVGSYANAVKHNRIDSKAKEGMMKHLEAFSQSLFRRNMGSTMTMLATRAAINWKEKTQ